MSDLKQMPWGESPYDGKEPEEVVRDFAYTRGDIKEEYAQKQLANWITRYGMHEKLLGKKYSEIQLAVAWISGAIITSVFWWFVWMLFFHD